MIKLIASDMDGTLLNGSHEVGKETVQAIKEAKDAGIEVIIATGRSYKEAVVPLKNAGLSLPVIVVNGAEIRNEKGEQLYQEGLSTQKANEAADALEQLDIYFEIYTEEGTYTNHREHGIQLLIDIFLTSNPDTPLPHVKEEAENRYDEGHVHVVDDYHAVFSSSETVYKFLAFSSKPEKLEKAKEVLNNLGGLAISSSGKENLEITSVDAQKGIALEWFINQRGIDAEDVMAIGDNYNDVSMMKLAGWSVAMGNAPKDIQEICRHVTSTNREEGVAKAIRKLTETEAKV
ncbi:Cof-type HAD-IIB family hydrolase [Jeotgalibacillus terrae]|uniref:Cof-type HAD-IIB family hydrolase n=1 Tax=Jeotgalibacillus terrae TaxID=587735 RepID=A0ABW5ZIT9_9BACL|nr:Cof-type HAD-IIB family hydrolase [Jeotgalibacillus terrae]MBM7580318.1 Cof subfamily protein (haloacid dehalogenase superfamily) [Jeotgalibacillus terrae]